MNVSRPKASMSVSEHIMYSFINTLNNYTSTSNSGNVSMPIKFKFLINPESIQTIFKYVSIDSALTILLGRLFHTAIILLLKNAYVNYNACVLIAFYIYYLYNNLASSAYKNNSDALLQLSTKSLIKIIIRYNLHWVDQL